MNEEFTPAEKIVGTLFTIIIVGIIAAVVAALVGITIISAGERGVVVNLGKVDRVLDEGFYFINPVVNDVITFEVRTVKDEVQATAASKDLQTISAVVAVNYNLDPATVGTMYETIGRDYKARIIDPSVQESVKAATSKYTAEELITKRQAVRDDIKDNLTARLEKNGVLVTDVSIVDFNFSQSFNAAIEAKVTAEQEALAEKNRLEKVKYESEQKITQAKAEAEAIRIQAQAITQQGGQDYVQLKTVQKWDGKLPVNMYAGAALPFLQVK